MTNECPNDEDRNVSTLVHAGFLRHSTFDIRICHFGQQAAYNLALGAEFLYGQACISPFARKDRDLFSLP
jgi:hypothetical protein